MAPPEELITLGLHSDVSRAVTLDGAAYFLATSAAEGRELWRTDGTAVGTTIVKDVAPGVAWGAAQGSLAPVVLDGFVYFAAKPDGATLQLWRSDGTAAGTQAVADLPGALNVSDLVTAGSRLFFIVDLPGSYSTSRELWVSDGTAAGTVSIKGLYTTYPVSLTVFGTRVAFLDSDSYRDPHILWVSDGTAAGTILVANPYSVRSMGRIGDQILFSTVPAYYSYPELWKTDGTVAGTTKVRDGVLATQILPAATMSYLVAGTQLWRTDGTDVGTILLRDFGPEYNVAASPCYNGCAQVRMRGASGDRLYVTTSGYTDMAQHDLWITDGTPASTLKISALGTPPSVGYSPGTEGIVIGSDLYFAAPAEDHGTELWKSDGTAGGTFVVLNATPETYVSYTTTIGYDSEMQSMSNFNGKLLLSLNDRIHGRELWTSDGTSAGTNIVRNINPEGSISGRVYDQATNAPVTSAKVELWHLDIYGTYRLVRSFAVDANGLYTIDGLPTLTYFLIAKNSEGYINEVYADRQCTACSVVASDGIRVESPYPVENVDFGLVKGGQISGRVTESETGAPIAGLPVVVARTFGSALMTVTTDTDGKYVTPAGLPDAKYLVYTPTTQGYSSVIYDGWSCAAGCNSASTGSAVAVTAGNVTANVNFTLAKYGKIAGMITDGVTGGPLAGATIAAHLRGNEFGSFVRTAVTDSSGAYELVLPDGTYTLLMSASGFISEFWENVQCTSSCSFHGGTAIVPVPGSTVSTYNATLQPNGGRIRGSIRSAVEGTDLYSYVRLYEARTGALIVSRDATGSFEFQSLPSGSYYVVVTPAYQTAVYLPEIWDGANGKYCDACALTTGTAITISGTNLVSNIDFRLDRSAVVSGRLYDAVTNAPVDARLSVYDSTGREVAYLWSSSGQYTINQRLAAAKYSIIVTPYTSGYYRMYYGGTYACPGCAVYGGTLVDAVVNSTVTADFAFRHMGIVRGTVRSASGSPLYANVTAYAVSGVEVGYGYTDSTGSYSLSAIGPVIVKASASGYVTETHDGQECPNCYDAPPINVASESTQTVDFFLNTPGKITGRLVDPDGSGIPYATVQVYDETGSGGLANYVYTDASGYFTRSNLGSGTYYLHAAELGANGRPTTYNGVQCDTFCKNSATPVTVASGGTTNVTFTVVPYGRISGVLTNDATGKGIGGVGVVIWNLGTQRAQARVTTASDGSYVAYVRTSSYAVYTETANYYNEVFTTGGGVACSGACNPSAGTAITLSPGAPEATASFGLVARKRDAMMDFDGDGRSEVIWRNASTGSFAMWQMNGRTLLNGASFWTLSDSTWKVLGYGDFDGDGDDDFFFRNSTSGGTAVWLMQGRTIARNVGSVSVPDMTWQMHAIGDFNGDGRDELIWRNTSTGQVAMWEMNGEQVLNGAIFATVSDLNWQIQLAADFNGDGKDEILWRNTSNGMLAMWDLNGRTLLNTAALSASATLDWTIVSAGDYNGDGNADLLWRNTSGLTAMWEMRHRTPFDTRTLVTVPAEWACERSGDFHGDGKDEVLWRNANTGAVAMWEMQGHTIQNGATFYTVADQQWKIQPRGGVRPALTSP